MGTAAVHSANLPDSPRVTVVFGGVDDEPADVGMVIVQVPPGAGMPAHRHHGSDVILTPTRGSVLVSKDGQEVTVTPGDALLITKDEPVALTNPGNETAELIVAAGPPAFVTTVSRWPRAE
jgi:quercetin dioxygenase-like cupin family protein